MKMLIKSILISLLLIVAASAYAASDMLAIQVFVCEFNEESDASEDDVFKLASAWLKAARTMPGGKNLNAYIRFPIAEGPEGEGDFRFVIATPTFAEWGAFTDAYEGSAAQKVDDEFDNLVDCGDSTIWEGMKLE